MPCLTTPKSILITSVSGGIGSHLVPLLFDQSPQPKLVLPTRNAENLKSALLSISKAGQYVFLPQISVRDPVWVESLSKDNELNTIFLYLTGSDEMTTALILLDAIRRIPAIKKLAYPSSIGEFTSETDSRIPSARVRYPRQLAKAIIEQRLKYRPLDLEWTILGPTIFFANDNMQISIITSKGGLSGLSRHGVSRIALSDIALRARNAMYDTNGA
ncbi:hypothetical protein DPSP01_014328 [Paraphaeosphaeria sporulosa]